MEEFIEICEPRNVVCLDTEENLKEKQKKKVNVL